MDNSIRQRIGHAADGAVRAQAAGGDRIEQVFESDESPPSGLMAVWELGEYRGELKYLRYPDTGEPMDSPWFGQVYGPDPFDGRNRKLWSLSHTDRGTVVEKIKQRLRREARRGDRRGVARAPTRPQAAGEGQWEKVSARDLREGDRVRVRVNDRASGHLGRGTLEGVVANVFHPDVVFDFDSVDGTNTWYSDIGYIHGYHTGLERHSDIGKVLGIERLSGMGAEFAREYASNRFLPDDTYAVYDWQTKGFVRSNDMFGQQVFGDRESAEEVASDPQHVVVELVPVDRGVQG